MRTGSIEPNWEAARSRVRTQPWAAGILERVEEDFTRWETMLRIPSPTAPTEWTHHYFCDDGARLVFDPASPHRHVCPECGEVRTGEVLDGAWRTMMHNAAASQAQRAVVLMRLDEDPERREHARRALVGLLEQYADTYEEHPVHGDKVGQGRVMPQSLDEAIWAIALLRSVRWAGEALPASTRARVRHLASSIAVLLEPQLGMVHNIHCWIVAALAECAAAIGDRALQERVRSGPHGAEQQIREGFRAEGLWYETSAFYHFYALAALLSYREASGVDGLSTAGARVLGQAIQAPVQLAYSDGRLPAYGDCWPLGRLEDFGTHVAVAAAVLPECTIDAAPYRDRRPEERPVDLWIGSRWETPCSRSAPGLSSLAALVFGPGSLSPHPAGDETRSEGAVAPGSAAPSSFLWPDAGIGVLASAQARVTLRFGRDVGMHDHHDRLAVDVEIPGVWSSLDLGSGGYGAAQTRWMRSPAAHSIGSVHDETQPAVDGVLDEWSSTHVSARAAWRDRRLHRSIRLVEDGWTDTMELGAEDPGPLQWTFHGDGTVVAAGTPEPEARPVDLGRLPGVECYRNVRRLAHDADGVVRLTWDVPGAPELMLPLPPGGAAYAALGEANPSGLPLGIVIIRVVARSMTVAARFRTAEHLPVVGGASAGRLP
ncbi:hypothetical protein [Brachybacterium hainanense]|uniref:Alginate lyase domain-containing protein n=1 Tax=Brachybacterium hainanense TaxID=1541174 RepID=A0ABV6RBP2_9MICO